MTDLPRPSSYDDTPIYTIKTVVQQTAVSPATLRAWERRYNILTPSRSNGGYRLYSERDIAILLWLKSQVDSGMSISRAVALLQRHHRAGEEPELATPPALGRRAVSEAAATGSGARDTRTVSQELTSRLLAFDEAGAEAVLAEAFALYPIEVVAEEVMGAALVEVGELWHQGKASIVQEHFATALLRRRLTALLDAYESPAGSPLAIAGAAPGEWHDVGILLVALFLKRHGWRVIYLGQNVPADHLVREVARLRPDLVCLSATTVESAARLAEIEGLLAELPGPRPRLIYGGNALNLHPELKARFAHAYVAATARELIAVTSPR